MAQASDLITNFVEGSDPLDKLMLMEQAERLEEGAKRFNAGPKTPEQKADAILENQGEIVGELNKFFKEAENQLGVDNGDVKDFRMQLDSLLGLSEMTNFARGSTGSTLDEAKRDSIETFNKVFESQLGDLEKRVQTIGQTIENKKEMQKEGRERADSNRSNDSGIGSPGMGSP